MNATIRLVHQALIDAIQCGQEDYAYGYVRLLRLLMRAER